MQATLSSPLSSSRKSVQFHWITFLLISALLHIVLAIVMQKQIKIGAEPFSNKLKEVKALSTYLVSLPKPPSLQATIQVTPPAIDSKEDDSLDNDKQPLIQQDILVDPNEPDAMHDDSVVQTQNEFKGGENLDAISEISNKSVIREPQKPQSFTEGYFERLNRSAANALAVGESHSYHINKNRIKLPKQTESLFEDKYGLGNPKPIAVDCSSSVKKGLVALASLTGGRMGCSSNPKIQGFIDKRLKKQSTELLSSEDSNKR